MTSVSTLAPVPGLPPAHLKKRTMIKDEVGKTRATSYVLPVDGHTYGKVVAKDAEGAGAVLSEWVAAQPSKPKISQRSFVKTNILALKEGCITSSEQRKFAEEHPDIRFKQVYGQLLDKPPVPFKGPYGLPSAEKTEAEDVKKLLEGNFTSYTNDEADYPDLSGISHKGKLPAPRGTKASAGHDIRTRNGAASSTGKDAFKMKRFTNIPAKVHNQ